MEFVVATRVDLFLPFDNVRFVDTYGCQLVRVKCQRGIKIRYWVVR